MSLTSPHIRRNKLKVCCLADTHTLENRVYVPWCDLILHAGDITNTGELESLESFNEWCRKQTVPVICIPGNHDRSLPDQAAREILTHCTLLLDSETTFNGYKIYGSPWTPWFGGHYWAFNKYRGKEIKEVWDKIPKDTDILITHGPPNGVLDRVPRTYTPQGCEELRTILNGMKLKLHVFGHLHLQGGIKWQDPNNRTWYVNAAVCNEAYEPINPITVIDI